MDDDAIVEMFVEVVAICAFGDSGAASSAAVGLIIAGAVSSPSIIAPWSETELLPSLILISCFRLVSLYFES